MKLPAGQVWLPRTPEQFDTLVATVCKKFKLENLEHAAAIMSRAIKHIDPYIATTTLDYMGQAILKDIANQIATHKGELIGHACQIRLITNELRKNPGNQQARDELEKAARDGSKAAQDALASLDPLTPDIPTGTVMSETQH